MPRISARIVDCPMAFDFVCDRKWSQLTKTSNPKIRHCDRCLKDVYLCETDKERQEAARNRQCVALVNIRMMGLPEDPDRKK